MTRHVYTLLCKQCKNYQCISGLNIIFWRKYNELLKFSIIFLRAQRYHRNRRKMNIVHYNSAFFWPYSCLLLRRQSLRKNAVVKAINPTISSTFYFRKAQRLRSLGSDGKPSFRDLLDGIRIRLFRQERFQLTHSFPGCISRGHCTCLDNRPQCRRYLWPTSAACRKEPVGASGNEWPETLEEEEIYNEEELSGEIYSGKPEAGSTKGHAPIPIFKRTFVTAVALANL